MGVTNSNKVVDVDRISCGGSLQVTLALTAAPDIVANPADIVLVLDRSGSMAGTPLGSMKAGAKIFIDIIDQSTDGAQDGQIGSGSRIGIVSFSSAATVDAQLITSVDALDAAVDSLTAGGSTNHADAFAQATQLLDTPSGNAKIIVLFTDGNTTAGPPPAPVAAAARAQGIVIYCIGLIGSGGLDIDALNDWATDPDDSHVAVTPDESELEQLFAELAANISKPGATDIVIDEVVSPDFAITSIQAPTKGTAAMVDARSLQWTIPALGVSGNEGAELTFLVRHTGQTSGTLPVNQSITYADAEGNVVSFPSPTVSVECGVVVQPEPCPAPVELTVMGCADAVRVDLGEVALSSQGRILQLDVTLQNVCPGRRIALAAILTEVGPGGEEQPRGMKTLLIPAHSAATCRDVRVECIPFVLPEELSLSGGAMCAPRRFKVRFLANSVDTDFCCCQKKDAVR